MEAIGDFLSMGGYAVFVWPAFGVTVVVMVGLLVTSIRALRQERHTLALMESARPRRHGPGASQPEDTEAGTEKQAAGEA